MALPKDIEVPKSSGQFTKLADGSTKLRILSDVIFGYEGWKDKKPFRIEGPVCTITEDQVDKDMNGNPNINYFWAFEVWNYNENKIQTWEITQKTIMGALQDLENNESWGDLKEYDIEVIRKKEGDMVKYNVVAIPPKPLSEEIKKAYEESDIDYRKLFEGEYPQKEEVIQTESSPFQDTGEKF